MKKLAVVFASLVLTVALVAGCGKSRQTYITPDGKKVTVTAKGSPTGESGKIEIESAEGKFSMSHDAEKTTISEAELGAPVYPGARVEGTSEFENMGGKGGSMKNVVLVTPDGFDKVKAFYKSRLKGARSSWSASDEESKMMTMHHGTDEDSLNITITRQKDEDHTNIVVIRTQKLSTKE